MASCDLAYEEDYAAWKAGVFETPQFLSAAGAAQAAPAEAPRGPAFDKAHPFMATLLHVERLSGQGSAKAVNHVEISLAGGGADLDYRAGDALGVWPVNCGAEVAALLAATGFAGSERVLLKAGPATLRAALLSRLDLATVTPAAAQVWGIAAEPGAQLIDLLARGIPGLTPQGLVDGLRPLQPRLYSIASGPSAHPGEVHLTVGEVHYALATPRKGCASTYLGNRLAPGSPVGVYLHRSERFHLPADDVPAIMIGPGTGIAPFRAFLEEREARRAAGDNWLFFGDRHAEHDFLYRDRIAGWSASGLLTRASFAWSRDGAEKVYVQDLIRAEGAAVLGLAREGRGGVRVRRRGADGRRRGPRAPRRGLRARRPRRGGGGGLPRGSSGGRGAICGTCTSGRRPARSGPCSPAGAGGARDRGGTQQVEEHRGMGFERVTDVEIGLRLGNLVEHGPEDGEGDRRAEDEVREADGVERTERPAGDARGDDVAHHLPHRLDEPVVEAARDLRHDPRGLGHDRGHAAGGGVHAGAVDHRHGASDAGLVIERGVARDGPHLGGVVGQPGADGGDEQRLLGREMVVERCLLQAAGSGDVAHRRARVALRQEVLRGARRERSLSAPSIVHRQFSFALPDGRVITKALRPIGRETPRGCGRMFRITRPVGRTACRALALAAAAALWSGAGAAQDLAPSGVEKPAPSVKLVTATADGAADSRTFFGRIAARETVDLSFEVGGHLVELPVTEGRPVAQGTLVARLELGKFERAVEQAEIALAQAERAVARAETLARSNVASEVQAQDARTARDAAEVTLREVQAALEDATLTAPFDGLVAARLTPNFSNVATGQPIVRLHDMSEVRVEIDVPERLFQAAAPARVEWTGTLPQVEGPVPLTLAEYDAQTSSIGQTFRVSLALPDLDIPTLIPGASMNVTATAPGEAAAGVALPATALLPGADRVARVMIFSEGRVRSVPVEVVSLTGTDLRVRGLPDGARVVAVGGHLLTDGQEVREYRGLSVQER